MLTHRLITILTTVALLLTLSASGSAYTPNLTAVAEVVTTDYGLSYEVRENEIRIIRYTGSDTILDIPDEIDGIPVTSIGQSAFLFNNTIEKLYIPDSVVMIEKNAFDSCTALTSVRLPSNIGEISPHMFETCVKLQSVDIPEGVTTIGERAFYNCYKLETINFPDSLTTINDKKYEESAFQFTPWLQNHPAGLIYAGNVAYRYVGIAPANTDVVIADGTVSISYGAFLSCKGIRSIQIPGSVRKIDGYAFQKCSDLKNVTLEEGTESIGDYAFSYCTKLESITIPDSVTTLGTAAFYYCTSLSRAGLSSSMKQIEDNTFFNCSELGSIIIPEGISSIGSRAFTYCMSLQSIELPASVESIGSEVFAFCISMSDITVDDSNAQYASCDGVLFTEDMTRLITYPPYKDKTNYIIPEGTSIIEPTAFFSCTRLISVKIPDGVVSIGKQAFAYCSELNDVNIPDSVTSIGIYAFSDCDAMTSVTIPGSVTQIGTNAFGYIYDPDSNKDIVSEGYVIYGCPDSEAQRYAEKNSITFVPLSVLKGDVNADGVLDFNDVILLKRWLLCDTADLPLMEAADFDSNGVIDAMDLTGMKVHLLETK
ncbi:MAG: leucine-rich repeat protein [Oscillospiraceae bacterium]|nr:leucine-rich repeat protein [Oscillospiraceae bacterium]